jgi:hypothetical protein
VTVIQGPPGSGKTSVAVGFVQAIQGLSKPEYGDAVYLTAQSNVAVKNMAEKLVKSGFTQWKLIVSRDFHFDWYASLRQLPYRGSWSERWCLLRHEHLYEKIKLNVIESPKLPKTYLETERLFRGARVILCTLSMLSNKHLAESGLTRMFPLRTIVVDEASQIEVGDYLPVFHTFEKTLRRLCFVGDDKQRMPWSFVAAFKLSFTLFLTVAPYGQDDVPGLQSIFEIQDLRGDAIFLNIQCESQCVNTFQSIAQSSANLPVSLRSDAEANWEIHITGGLWW